MSTRRVVIIGGALGALGLGATAAAGVGPFAGPSDGAQIEQVRTTGVSTPTLSPSVSPTTLTAGSSITSLTADTSLSGVSAQSAPSTQSAPSPISSDSAPSAPSAPSGD